MKWKNIFCLWLRFWMDSHGVSVALREIGSVVPLYHFFPPLTFPISYLLQLWDCLLDSVTYRFSDIYHSPDSINRDRNRHENQNPPDISIIQRSLFITGLLKWGADIAHWKIGNIYTVICSTGCSEFLPECVLWNVPNLYHITFCRMFLVYTVTYST